MLKNKFYLLFQIVFYFAAFSVLLSNSFVGMDNDFGWHLKVGEQIVKERAVPDLDYYDYTMEGRSWVDHEWLSNAAIYLLYEKTGYIAVNIFFAGLVVIILIILNIYLKKYFTGNNLFFLFFFQALGLAASLPHFGVRIQELSVLNFLLLLFIIEHYNKNKKVKILFFLPPLFYLWASSHGGFLIGIFIMLFWIFIKTAEIFLSRFDYFSFLNYEKKLTYKNLAYFFIGAAAGSGATLLTPYGANLYSFLSGYQNNFYLTNIMEWLPFFYLPLQYWQLLFEAILTAVIFLAAYYCLKKKNYKISFWDTTISLLFLVLALKSKRHFPLLFVASFPFLLSFFSFFANTDFSFNDFYKKQRRPLLIIRTYLIIGLIAFSLLKVLNINFTNDPFAYFKKSYPHEATDFLKNHPEYDNLKMLNNYDWGGYLIWTMPERKLFIDGRLPQLAFANHTFLEEYLEFWQTGKSEEKLYQYNIGLVFINSKERQIKLNWFEKYFLGFKDEKTNNNKNNLRNYLDDSDSWQIVYKDEISIIYVKK